MGNKCEIKAIYCNSIIFSKSTVCSGHGSCIDTNVCSCKKGFYGIQCEQIEIYNCYSKLSLDSGVCSGNGVCIENNNCSCNYGWEGDQCQIKTFYFISKFAKCWGNNQLFF